VIDDENADHDADQQRRQKKIFHFVDTFTLQSRTVHAMENFVGIDVRPSFAERELTLHGGCSINRVRAGTTIPRSLQGKGRAKPGLFQFDVRMVPNYSVVLVTDAADVPADWPASAGRFAQAEKTNAAAQATMRMIRI
jgi:hypothetical protein